MRARTGPEHPLPRETPAGRRAGGTVVPSAGTTDQQLLNVVRQAVLAEAGPVTASRVAEAVQSSGRLLGTAGTLEAVERIRAELSGLGPLQPLVKDPAVTDIFVNDISSVWVDRGRGLQLSGVVFESEAQLRALAVRLISAGGRRLDDGSPCVDVRLEAGYRVHAVLPPISTLGTLLSIRIGRAEVFELEELVAAGTLSAAMAELLERIVAARLNFLISGATGSGKTTLLCSLLSRCDPGDRLVVIEDAAELYPRHPHQVGLQSRHPNLEGSGVIELAELVRQALRMRPDRLIVGECRGPEVRELLAAMNTGHSGGGGTIHANTAGSVPARLTALGALAGMSREAVALQAGHAVDVVIHMMRTPGGRMVTGIGMVAVDTGGVLTVQPAVRQGGGGVLDPEAGWALLQERLAGAGL